jgi:hypothetical protein
MLAMNNWRPDPVPHSMLNKIEREEKRFSNPALVSAGCWVQFPLRGKEGCERKWLTKGPPYGDPRKALGQRAKSLEV